MLHNVSAVPILLPRKNGCCLLIGWWILNGALDHVAGHARNLRTKPFLPFPMEGAMNFGWRAVVPGPVLKYRGQMPGLFDCRKSQVDLRLNLSAQYILMEADRSLFENFAWPLAQFLIGRKLIFFRLFLAPRDPLGALDRERCANDCGRICSVAIPIGDLRRNPGRRGPIKICNRFLRCLCVKPSSGKRRNNDLGEAPESSDEQQLGRHDAHKSEAE